MRQTKKKKRDEALELQQALNGPMAHPLRHECWLLLCERVASPRQLANLIGCELDEASYHVRILLKQEVIELVTERQVRGATQHFYRAIKRSYVSNEEWAAMTPEQRAEATIMTLRYHYSDIQLALRAGTFDSRPNRYLVRRPMRFDEQGFQEMAEVEDERLGRSLEIEARSVARLEADPTLTEIPTASTSMFYEMPPRPPLEEPIPAD